MINDHTSPPERFKFTTPYPFKFTVRKESRSRCESLHSSKDGECFTDNLENLKQFRALPMPGRTFLLSDQFKNQSRRNSVFDEFRASSCDRKKHQSVYSSALSEVPFQTSSTPDLSRLSLQRDTPKSDAKFNFKPTSSPKTRNAQPFAEFLAEQEVMREIRVKHRANQLLKTSRLPFSGSHWQCQRKKCEITDEQHLSRKLQKRISNNSKPVVQPKIRSPRCKFRDVIDNQIKSNVNSDSKKSATVTASNTLTVLPEKDIGHKSPPTVPRMTHSSMLREFTNRCESS